MQGLKQVQFAMGLQLADHGSVIMNVQEEKVCALTTDGCFDAARLAVLHSREVL